MVIFVNGNYVENGPVVISVDDLGFMRGYGIFEYVRVYNGSIFHLKKHYDRFLKSASQLYLDVPYSIYEVEAIIKALLEKNGCESCGVRIFLTGQPTFIVKLEHPEPLPKRLYEEGVSLMTSKRVRHLPECKSLHYLPNMLALKEARAAGYFDALFMGPCGAFLEATTSNFFGVKEGRIITADKGVLKGITREVVLELSGGSEEEVFDVDEAFLTSTNKEILPVTKIDDRELEVGPITQKLMGQFQDYLRREVSLLTKS